MSFKHSRSYLSFRNYVNTRQRYILDDTSKDFLNSIIDTCTDREKTIPAGTTVWRAQKGHSLKPYYEDSQYIDDFPSPFPNDRMKPLVDSAAEGRANPKGIPCLYVATHIKTAMAEVRPWLGAILSVATLEVVRDLKILNFSVNYGQTYPKFILEKHTAEEIIESVWSAIDNAFSEPTTSTDMKSEYAATQIISEFIKSKGYDGIVYKSSLADGHNICLFDLDSADVVSCSIHKTTGIEFNFEHLKEY